MNNPCDKCGMNGRCDEPELAAYDIARVHCGPYAKYLGYQEGLAEAESKVRKREQEIRAWLKSEQKVRDGTDVYTTPTYLAQRLSEWLKGEGRG